MDATSRETIVQFLREVGMKLARPVRIAVGGSTALIAGGVLARSTDDVDVVDEVPAEIRTQHALLDELARSYGLRLTHFQSHYLPEGWDARVQSLGRLGNLEVHLVEVYDVFLSKLFSERRKDRDDLRVLAPQLDKAVLVSRFRDTTTSLRAEAHLRQAAADNWFVLYGEPLPA
jgi:hypothetical protein